MSDVSIRLKRLFNNGRCLDIAIDHGFFGEVSFLTGIEDMKNAVDTLITAAPDAIQLTIGQAKLLQDNPNRNKPALVLRTDVANVYGKVIPDHLFSILLGDPVLQAVRLDAAIVVVNLLDLPGRPELKDACIRNIMTLKAQCEHYGMPLMVEPLVMKDASAGGYTSDGELEKILPLVRQAVELGADVIKADPTDNAADYYHVVKVCGDIPVLVRGGGRVSDEELLSRTAEVLKQGAAGIVYGRNIIAHPKPAKITKALMSMLHDKTSVSEALKIISA
jgi:DhnA family fructose-bisphosphate aldolase class Ia